MKTYYYELNEDNRILWIDEVDKLNMVDPEIISPSVELESIDHINVWWDKIIGGEFVHETFEGIDTTQDDLKAELTGIQQWFVDNDWKPNKIITDEWTTDDPRWIQYLSEREIKRARQDEINALMGV
jgi:hypothetical protein